MERLFKLCPSALAFAAISICGCGEPEAFHNGADSGSPGLDARPAGTGGTMGTGGAGTGGIVATGGRGTGGSGSGGMTGTGGSGSGGRGTGGANTGGRGGSGSGGSAVGGRGTGGSATGGAAVGGRGSGGRATGGSGVGGRATGGAAVGGRGTGGSSAGGSGTGGRGTGGAGTGGTTGTGPCAGLCSNPITVEFKTNSGPLGTAATCHQVVSTIQGLVCGNFVAPRTFNVNGTQIDCAMQFTLPPIRMGGYCMRASAGDYSYAYFATF